MLVLPNILVAFDDALEICLSLQIHTLSCFVWQEREFRLLISSTPSGQGRGGLPASLYIKSPFRQLSPTALSGSQDQFSFTALRAGVDLH